MRTMEINGLDTEYDYYYRGYWDETKHYSNIEIDRMTRFGKEYPEDCIYFAKEAEVWEDAGGMQIDAVVYKGYWDKDENEVTEEVDGKELELAQEMMLEVLMLYY